MSSFAPVQPHRAPPDPSKHVNFSFGMVLGVDDFDQEFAYLSGRDRWIVRDLLGYGVVSGLGLSVEEETGKGPRVMVRPGVAVTPSGQLICVSPTQCAYLNDWLRANREEVERNLDVSLSLPLAVVACYRECPADDVPIPGEPCRSEDDLMAPSRLRDHFELELRLRPPAQQEEDAVRDLMTWLRQVPVVDGPGSDLDAFLDAIRAAAQPEQPSPPDFLYGSPPATLAIPSDRACEYLQALALLWTTELRARWRQPVPGCDEAPGAATTTPDGDCLLLGELVVPLTPDPLTGELLVSGAVDVGIDLSRRATLLHLRLLQEWLLCGPVAQAPAPGGVVAAARVDVGGGTTPAPLFAHNVLGVTRIADTLYHIAVTGFDPAQRYVVDGTPMTSVDNDVPHTFELVSEDDPALAALLGGVPDPGVVVCVRRADGSAPEAGFMVRISSFGGGA